MEDEQFEAALDAFDALLSASPGLLGDFDSDGSLTALDIDLLSAEVTSGTNTMSFDLTGDNVVDGQDRVLWVEDLAGTVFGDADFDGGVLFSDFLALSSNFGSTGGWAEGDFDGNGQIEFSDFLTLSANFGSSSEISAAVPEPSGALLFGCAFAICFAARRGRA